jgi:hypothetical protein
MTTLITIIGIHGYSRTTPDRKVTSATGVTTPKLIHTFMLGFAGVYTHDNPVYVCINGINVCRNGVNAYINLVNVNIYSGMRWHCIGKANAYHNL